MSEWSKSMAQRIRESEERSSQKTEKSLQDGKTRRDGLKHDWKKLERLLGQMCGDLEGEEIPGVHLTVITGKEAITVRRKDTSAKIEGTYSEVTGDIEFRGMRPNGHNFYEKYHLKLSSGGGEAWFFEDARGTPKSIHAIADSIIAALATAD
jgi:hypothetical protein